MRTICVYCGSNMGADPEYLQVARDLGRHLSESGIGLVYGGSNRGLMGVVANSVLSNNGKVTAIMPLDLKQRAGHENDAELIIVDTMH